jgi:hypothetical protein
MVFAMALAEWADKDPGDLFAAWFGRKPVKSAAAAPAGTAIAAMETAAVSATVVPGSSAKRGSRPKASKALAGTLAKNKSVRKKR